MNHRAHIVLKGGADWHDWVLNNHATAIVTTEHPASSYGQPVVIVEGSLLDYSSIGREIGRASCRERV